MREDQYWLSARWESERAAHEMWADEDVGNQHAPRRPVRRLNLAAALTALHAALRHVTLWPAR